MAELCRGADTNGEGFPGFRAALPPGAWVYGIILFVIGVCMAVPVWRHKGVDWGGVFVPAGARLVHGQDFYSWREGFVYPPASALLAAPFSFLNARVSSMLWYAISFGCLVGMLW